MINLLPQGLRKELYLEKVYKMVFVLGMVIFISIVSLVLVLLSAKFYILSEIIFQKTTLNAVQPAGLADVKNIVNKYNAILPDIAQFYSNKNYFNDVLQQISNNLPQGISILSTSLNREDNGIIKENISGTSISRSNLVLFKNYIESNKNIKNSQFSPESWIKDTNSTFNLTFEFSNGQP